MAKSAKVGDLVCYRLDPEFRAMVIGRMPRSRYFMIMVLKESPQLASWQPGTVYHWGRASEFPVAP